MPCCVTMRPRSQPIHTSWQQSEVLIRALSDGSHGTIQILLILLMILSCILNLLSIIGIFVIIYFPWPHRGMTFTSSNKIAWVFIVGCLKIILMPSLKPVVWRPDTAPWEDSGVRSPRQFFGGDVRLNFSALADGSTAAMLHSAEVAVCHVTFLNRSSKLYGDGRLHPAHVISSKHDVKLSVVFVLLKFWCDAEGCIRFVPHKAVIALWVEATCGARKVCSPKEKRRKGNECVLEDVYYVECDVFENGHFAYISHGHSWHEQLTLKIATRTA